MNIETFMGMYPSSEMETGTFNRQIFQKKEFRDLKLPREQPSLPEKGEVYLHQKLIARFLSSFTLYDEMFLFHSPGTGKTITAIHTIERLMEDVQFPFRKAVILVPNETLVERFQQEIVFTGTQGKYYTENEDDAHLPYEERREGWFRQGKKAIRGVYRVTTHERFINQLKKSWHVPDRVRDEFSNCVLVVDEVHRILSNREWNTMFRELIGMMRNRKVLLMSGTPMKNHVREIAPLMNLILPDSKQFRVDGEFDVTYLDREGHLRPEVWEELSEKLTGRISYLKSKPNIPFRFVGGVVEGVSYPLYQTRMSGFQEQVYRSIIGNNETFYKESLQASMFVFPDGTFGMRGFEKNVVERRNGKFVCPTLQSLFNRSDEEKKAFLSKYAPKFLGVVEHILRNPTKNTFVYTYFMKGSGAILFGLCLELFGYSRTYNGNVHSKRPRYAILSDSIGTNLSSVLDTFNSPQNKRGERIQILIGGRQVEEGITFYSVQNIHILTPTWNFSSLDQALARSIRLRAHRYLPPQTLVHIYLHVCLSGTAESTDIQLYRLSQQKDVSIKEMEYLIKVSAFDCGLTYDRNAELGGRDGSRECEYMDCVYRCRGLETLPMEISVDKSTFQVYYQTEYLDTLKKLLTRLFQTQFWTTLHELESHLQHEYTPYQIFVGMYTLIRQNMTFRNRYGFPCYLKEHQNLFFLSAHVQDDVPTDAFYAEYPMLQQPRSFKEVVEYVFTSEDRLNARLKRIAQYPFDRQIEEIPLAQPLVQESLIEGALTAQREGMSTPLTDWILTHYAPYMDDEGGVVFMDGYRRTWDVETGEWETQTLNRDMSQRKLELIQSEQGVFGYYNAKKQFVVVDLHAIPAEFRLHESTKRGKVCSFYTHSQLLELMRRLGIPFPEDEPVPKKKSVLCRRLETWMEEQSLIV